MSTTLYQPWVHRLAVLTAVLSLAPITVGALVTTMDAGMAFPDWPTSDGQGMFAYPWLKSVGDKFLEHGHRLAGIAIGICSIVLAVVMGFGERRQWARSLGLVVLIAVVGQGLMGGQRVVRDSRDMALLHGLFAAWVFAGMSVVALMTSRGWHASHTVKPLEWSRLPLVSAITVVCLIQAQYLLGGLLRHHGMVVFEHFAGAFCVLLSVLWLWYGAMCTGIQWLRSNAHALCAVVLCQILLGLITFAAKFGFGDYVATPGAPLAVWTRTGHVLLGMLVWMLAVQYLVRVSRVNWVLKRSETTSEAVPLNTSVGAMLGGAS